MKAVIFDMDGLLLDTEKAAFRLFNEVIGQYGLHIDLNTYADFIGLTKQNFFQSVKNELDGVEDIEKIIDSFYAKVNKEWVTSIPDIKKGAVQLIKYLRENDIPIAVATSTRQAQALRLLRKTNLLNCFDGVITGDMVTKSKPSPDIFFETFRRLQIDREDIIILEDSANGIRAAHASGARPVLVPDIKMPSEEVQKLAQKVYPSLADFLNDIKKGYL